MGIFTYEIKVKCDNCGKDCVIKIKKGVAVGDAIKMSSIKCTNCGVILNPKEYSTQWLK